MNVIDTIIVFLLVKVIVELLKGLSEKGQTIIVVTHDMDVTQWTDRIITIARNR